MSFEGTGRGRAHADRLPLFERSSSMCPSCHRSFAAARYCLRGSVMTLSTSNGFTSTSTGFVCSPTPSRPPPYLLTVRSGLTARPSQSDPCDRTLTGQGQVLFTHQAEQGEGKSDSRHSRPRTLRRRRSCRLDRPGSLGRSYKPGSTSHLVLPRLRLVAICFSLAKSASRGKRGVAFTSAGRQTKKGTRGLRHRELSSLVGSAPSLTVTRPPTSTFASTSLRAVQPYHRRL